METLTVAEFQEMLEKIMGENLKIRVWDGEKVLYIESIDMEDDTIYINVK